MHSLLLTVAVAFEWRQALEIVDTVVAICGIAALIFAAIQFRDARHHSHELSRHSTQLQDQTTELSNHTKQLQTQTDELMRLEESLSTRYLGPFPDFMDDIVDTISKAEHTLFIFCDYPAYACLSNIQGFREYERAIEDLIADEKEVRLICFDADRQRKYLERQFRLNTPESWEAWRSHEDTRKRLESLIKSHKATKGLDTLQVSTLSTEQFSDLMLATNKRTMDTVFGDAVETLETDELAPIYFWLVDSKEAVFTISSLSDGVPEHGFWTRSSEFAIAFRGLWNRYAEAARAGRSISAM